MNVERVEEINDREKGFNLFTVTPRQLFLKSAAVSDIPSSVLVVEETDDSLNLLSFAQEMRESKAEVIMPLVGITCIVHPSQIFCFRGSLKGVVKSVSLKGIVKSVSLKGVVKSVSLKGVV